MLVESAVGLLPTRVPTPFSNQPSQLSIASNSHIIHRFNQVSDGPIRPCDATRLPLSGVQRRFVDVPDDGNCLMHAVWLGLSTLLRLYPHLKVGPCSLPFDLHCFAFAREE